MTESRSVGDEVFVAGSDAVPVVDPLAEPPAAETADPRAAATPPAGATPVDTEDPFQSAITAQLEAVARMQEEMKGLEGRARVLDGHVEVRVNPAGALLDLRIDDRVMHLGGDELAGHVLAAVQQAAAEVGTRLQTIVGGVVPPDVLEAMMRGDVPDSERESVREELAARRGQR